MKSYKLVNSKEVQEKAFRLGYSWVHGVGVMHEDEPFLFTNSEGRLGWDADPRHFATSDKQEITQADFLALPEPFKVGDWARADFSAPRKDISFVVFRVGKVKDGCLYEMLQNGVDITGSYLEKNCIKLTDEQIKVLGLED